MDFHMTVPLLACVNHCTDMPCSALKHSRECLWGRRRKSLSVDCKIGSSHVRDEVQLSEAKKKVQLTDRGLGPIICGLHRPAEARGQASGQARPRGVARQSRGCCPKGSQLGRGQARPVVPVEVCAAQLNRGTLNNDT